jgi:hypothetical protein
VPDGELGAYRPPNCEGEGDAQKCWLPVEDLAQIFETCWSPFVNPAGARWVDCDLVRNLESTPDLAILRPDVVGGTMRRFLGLIVGVLAVAACGSPSEATDAAADAAADVDVLAEIGEATDEIEPPLPAATDYLVVAANDLAGTAAAFAAYREQTGHRAEVALLADLGITDAAVPEEAVVTAIRDRVRTSFEARDPDVPFYRQD